MCAHGERWEQKERESYVGSYVESYVGSLGGLILGPWDCDLSQRQMFDRRSHPGAPDFIHFKRTDRLYWFIIDL